MSFFRGFKYAWRGIIYCIKNERNMRFHTVAALYVLIFARFFNFTREALAVIMLTIGIVMALEAVNTAIEELCDKVSPEKNEFIKHCKDAAAGAVLIAAIFAAVVGIILFGNIDGLLTMYNFYISHPINLSVLVLSGVGAVLFIALGPGRIKYMITRNKGKNNGGKHNDKQ